MRKEVLHDFQNMLTEQLGPESKLVYVTWRKNGFFAAICAWQPGYFKGILYERRCSLGWMFSIFILFITFFREI